MMVRRPKNFSDTGAPTNQGILRCRMQPVVRAVSQFQKEPPQIIIKLVGNFLGIDGQAFANDDQRSAVPIIGKFSIVSQ